MAFALFLWACDGKPCTDPPKYDERDEELVERLDDMLDDADAYDHQKTRVLKINDGLDDDRVEFRKEYQRIRRRMVNELVAVKPDADVFHALLYDLHTVFMRYVYEVIDQSVKAHRWFTVEQRKAMTESWEEPPDDYKIPWSTKRAIDLAMIEIKATDPQKELVKKLRDDMEVRTDKLLKQQHAVRMELIREWHKKKVDPKVVRKLIDKGALQISLFMHTFTDSAYEVQHALTPQQRMWTNKQVNKLRYCQEK